MWLRFFPATPDVSPQSLGDWCTRKRAEKHPGSPRTRPRGLSDARPRMRPCFLRPLRVSLLRLWVTGVLAGALKNTRGRQERDPGFVGRQTPDVAALFFQPLRMSLLSLWVIGVLASALKNTRGRQERDPGVCRTPDPGCGRAFYGHSGCLSSALGDWCTRRRAEKHPGSPKARPWMWLRFFAATPGVSPQALGDWCTRRRAEKHPGSPRMRPRGLLNARPRMWPFFLRPLRVSFLRRWVIGVLAGALKNTRGRQKRDPGV